MKKADFRKLVKETILNVLKEKKQTLNEKFESKTAAMMFKKLSGSDKKFFQGMANSYDIDWANAPESAWGKGANPKLVNFFFVNKQKVNPFAGYNDWQTTVRPGLIGVTRGKEKLHIVTDRYSATPKAAGEKSVKGGFRGRSDRDAMGLGIQNLNNYKRFAEVADEVITLDLNQLPSATQIKKDRAEAKRGATALLDSKKVLEQNRKRYTKLLQAKVLAKGPDALKKMLDEGTSLVDKVFKFNTAMLKKGMVSSGWDSYQTVSNKYGNMVSAYENYVREAANYKKAAKKLVDLDDWQKNYVAAKAGEVQGYLTELKKAAEKVMDKNSFRKIYN
jgi:hypothetical protein|tara:strand:- start:80 stop:1078 length:999 start_codon:yes stop_codon:yes gene_type:complete